MYVLIESPNGEQIKATKKAYEVIYKTLYGYKIIEENKIKELETNFEPENKDVLEEQSKNKGKGRGRRPKLDLEVGE